MVEKLGKHLLQDSRRTKGKIENIDDDQKRRGIRTLRLREDSETQRRRKMNQKKILQKNLNSVV